MQYAVPIALEHRPPGSRCRENASLAPTTSTRLTTLPCVTRRHVCPCISFVKQLRNTVFEERTQSPHRSASSQMGRNRLNTSRAKSKGNRDTATPTGVATRFTAFEPCICVCARAHWRAKKRFQGCIAPGRHGSPVSRESHFRQGIPLASLSRITRLATSAAWD